MCGIGFIIGKTKNDLHYHLNNIVLSKAHRGPDFNDTLIRNLNNDLNLDFLIQDFHFRFNKFRKSTYG